MTGSPLVSVIVPTFNRAHVLNRTLDSILAQTFRDYEVVIIDDGSTDGTRSLVEPYLDGNPITYLYQENKGVAQARNTGVENSHGSYLAFCDSDDFWLPEKLEKQLRLFTSDIAIVFSDAYIFSDVSQPKAKMCELMPPCRGDTYVSLLRENFIVTSSVVVRKELMQRPFSALPVCEDWQMWLAVARQGLFDYVEEPLVYYYEHAQGLSNYKALLVESRLRVRIEELAFLNRATPNSRLLQMVSHLIMKDLVLFKILSLMPDRLMAIINHLYYRSRRIRKAIKYLVGS